MYIVHSQKDPLGSNITVDNGSNNDTLVNELSNLIPTFGGKEYQVHCFAHILNLIVKVSLLTFILYRG